MINPNMRLFVFLAALLFSAVSFGQDFKKKISIDALNAFVEEDINNLKSDEAINSVDIKASHWDTKIYNPYKHEKVTFPIEIKFEDSSYVSPIPIRKVITSRFGWRRGRAHKGIDIDLVTGDSVRSMFDGIVRFAKYSPGHGRTVVVRHYNGLETVYAHLSKYAVKANDTVKAGDLLGKGGASGNARGSHLHLVINYKGISINPEYLFDFGEENKIRSKTIWVTDNWVRPEVHNSKRRTKLQLLHTEEEAIASLETRKQIYIVKRGDTLSRISHRNNVSIASICKSNYIKRTTPIKIGQRLVLEYVF